MQIETRRAQIEVALAAAPIEELSALVRELDSLSARAALRRLSSPTCNSMPGAQAAPDFAALAWPLTRIRKLWLSTCQRVAART